jgi:hypothetical protein
VCGVGVPGSVERFGQYAARAAEFQTLRAALARFARSEQDNAAFNGGALPGEIAAAALLHLIDPSDPGDRTRMAFISAGLRSPPAFDDDGIEHVLALDWCWSALDRDARREFLLAVRERGKPLTSSDSPMEHRAFREKLLALAVVLAIDTEDEPGGSWHEFRRQLIRCRPRVF